MDGYYINTKNKYGLTPLHAAVLSRDRNAFKKYIEFGADINAKSCLRRTALHFAIRNSQPLKFQQDLSCNSGNPDSWMVKKLLSKSTIDVNVGDIRGDTPLMWAVMEQQDGIIFALLNKGADPNISNYDGKTALHIALSAENPNPHTVFTLLLSQPNLKINDKEGKNPIDMLIRNFRNTQKYRFAYVCLSTIAFFNQMEEYQKSKFESIPLLLQLLEECYAEIELMKSEYIAAGVTFFRFVQSGKDDQGLEIPVQQVYIPILKRLLSGRYPKYLFFILELLPKSNFCKVIESAIYEKDWEELLDNDCFTKPLDIEECTDATHTPECADATHTPECTDARHTPDCTDARHTPECTDARHTPECTDERYIPEYTDATHTPKCTDATLTPDYTDATHSQKCTDATQVCLRVTDIQRGIKTLNIDGSTELIDIEVYARATHTQTYNTEFCKISLNLEPCIDASDTNLYPKVLNTDTCRKINFVEVFSKIGIWHLFEYLSRLDLFCLLAALTKGKLPRSMRRIHQYHP